MIGKRRANLDGEIKTDYATIYDQCSQDVKDKFEVSEGWTETQAIQSIQELVRIIEQICVGFDDYKEEVHNLVKAPQTLFIYSQKESETVEEFLLNLTSLWDMAEAFGASPGIHKGLVNSLLTTPGRVVIPNTIMDAESELAEAETSEAVNAAVMISVADHKIFFPTEEQPWK